MNNINNKNNIKVGYQGLKGAFSYIASCKLYPKEQLINFSSFYEVFLALEHSQINVAVIPIENSYAGKVEETNILLKKFNIKIINKITIPIVHNLAGIHNTELQNITHIFSHRQALLQCKKTLQNILPNAQLIDKQNTAISAKFISETNNKNYACICSNEAIIEYKLKNLYPNFQDCKNNYTIFIAISK